MTKKIYLRTILLAMLVVAQSCTSNDPLDKRNIETTMNQVAEWQLAHPRHTANDWTNGAFYAGVYATLETTGSETLRKVLFALGDSVKWCPYRRWYHADDIAICQTFIDLYRTEKRREMIAATIDTIDKQLALPYPVKDVEVIKWWWCDALFMGPAALVKLGVTLGDDRYLKGNDTLFRECYDLLYDKEERLFARDLNYVIKGDVNDRREANGKKIFWSRGNGWVMGGLTRILKELPADYPVRPFYEQLFKDMAARILSIRQSDGLWRASLLDPDSYPGGETSGSSFFCYALAWGVNSGLLDKATYLPAVKETWTALYKCVNSEGRLGWAQPVGADPRKNFNADSYENYASGAFLLAGSEVVKLLSK